MTSPADSNNILVRKCAALEDFHECVALQRQIWNEQDLEVEPATLFVVAANTGGQVLGAFHRGLLVGFTLALVGIREGVPFLHSHMTGVHSAYRDRGVGRMLKLFQREDALRRNIRTICWTFDPLELRNAHFNLNRLGAICRKYLPNFYGVTTSPLHRNLATDRLYAEWQLDSARVIAAIENLPVVVPENAVAIEVALQNSESQTLENLQNLQSHLRAEFTKYFQRGYAAVAMRSDSSTPAYLLCPWSDF